MKKKLRVFFVLAVPLFSMSGCKKKADCGCDSNRSDHYMENVGGYLSYDQYKAKWVLSYMYEFSFRFYYPCNTDQDSLRVVLQAATQNQTFMVSFSGNVKSPCQSEVFQSSAPSATYNYIVVDSFRRYQ